MDHGLPTRVAERFVEWMAVRGIQLSAALDSLEKDFELALERECRRPYDAVLTVGDEHYDLCTGAACFFGEALRRRFGGTWYGKLSTKSGLNYYQTRIRFGAYHFAPFRWISYRLQNGRASEGAVADCLRAVIPSMQDHADHKQAQIDESIACGKTAVVYDVF
ncbi:MAG: hypothetical protein AAGM22_21620 [Acidobacteriota bacterium]